VQDLEIVGVRAIKDLVSGRDELAELVCGEQDIDPGVDTFNRPVNGHQETNRGVVLFATLVLQLDRMSTVVRQN
jgi:hypothetical protein